MPGAYLTTENILSAKMPANDIEAETVRDYLKALFLQLWADGESFNGKRPFGNSAWKYPIYEALIRLGYIEGRLDKDGHVESVDEFVDGTIANVITEWLSALLPE